MKPKKIFASLNITLIVISLVVLLVGGYGIYSVLTKSDSGSVDRSDSLSNEYYIVGREPTEYQIENFELLTAELEKSTRDHDTISDLVVRAFIIDFFTWSNKKGAWDVGGQQYMYNNGMFYRQAVYGYYKDIDVFINQYGSENLPTVSSITTVHFPTDPTTVDDVTYESYYIEATWEYESNSILDANQFQKQGYFKVIILKDGKYEILWMFDEW